MNNLSNLFDMSTHVDALDAVYFILTEMYGFQIMLYTVFKPNV